MNTHRMERPLRGAPPAYLANGLVGLRAGAIPLPQGSALLNGFVGLSPEKGTEEYAEAPYPVGADIELDGSWLSRRPDCVEFRDQSYDFSCGELRSRFAFRSRAATAEVEVLTLCCRTQPTLTLQEVAVTVDRPCRLTLQAHLGRLGLEGRLACRCQPARGADGIIRWESRGGLSSAGAAYAAEFAGGDLERRRRNDFGHEEDIELTHFLVAARPGQCYRLRQLGSLVPGLMHGEPHWQASRMVGIGRWHGFDKLRADNRAAWSELWKGRPRLVGADPRWQDIADACFFYLHSSVSPSTPSGVAPFGLSRRCEYSGHVFWDWETFMFPPVLLTAPDAARATMEYRSRLLGAARLNAQLNGYRGIQFPWQSGNGGFEVSPFYSGAAGGATEQHVNLDVAFAMIQFAHAAGDERFLRHHAWPVVEGVAEWIASRVTRTARGYEIRHVTGIDESRDNVHNDSETNGLCIVVLREAAALAARLGLPAPPAWRDIVERMVMPISPVDGRLQQYEGFEYEGGVCCPAPMMLQFPFGYRHGTDADRATAAFHLRHAATYLGMPMNSSNYAVWACRAGERGRALEFLETGTAARCIPPYLQFIETTKDPAYADKTVFVTACGAFLTAVLQGFTGIEFDPGGPAGWAKHPVALPEGWSAIEVECVWARGAPYRLAAAQGDARARIEPSGLS